MAAHFWDHWKTRNINARGTVVAGRCHVDYCPLTSAGPASMIVRHTAVRSGPLASRSGNAWAGGTPSGPCLRQGTGPL